ncbi:uncharacterized protein LAESUDRAFT_660442 [Laetiporus sulphureus 93-53]|uniref:Uncharacterized protein n=1 Tax=Laetiporus sulphureus 93-53 TaxID=1314785 RepID=A0A165CMI8_9APHY|nr:uncharacterized protein LAESUDRAFT_660442 [Laetiporus sulphureus 93-53]KZT03081.1 hypothetical protein LAESUDRAFT_660442 [Laetiporus sulphureus 93-53]
MTNWADDVIEEEMDDGEEMRSDGDVLGEVVPRVRKRAIGVQRTILSEEQWEVDVDALEASKSNPPSTAFRQCAQVHSDWVNDILLCNENQTLVSASSDGTVKAWNPHSQPASEPSTIGIHADYVRCLAYSREQRWIASGSFDRTIKLWDLAGASTGSPLTTLSPPDMSDPKSSVYAIKTDPYGSVIVSASPDRVVRLWDPRAGRRVSKLVGHTDNIRTMLLSEDAKYLLTGSTDASIKLWSLSSQRCLHTFTHHTESVWSLFSQHPTLEIFYSGDRSGLVCKVDVEGCADVSEGECIVLCQDTNEQGKSMGEAGGIDAIVAMDDSLLWTASGGSSSFKRWKVPPRKTVRAAALNAGRDSMPTTEIPGPASVESNNFSERRSGARNSIDFTSVASTSPRSVSIHPSAQASSPPPSKKSNRISLSPSLSPSLVSSHSAAPCDPDPFADKEGDETWYGIPFESLVRLTSPNNPFARFGGHGSFSRGPDPEIATLYSAASIMSMPRLTPRPMHSVLASPSKLLPGQRSTSPLQGERDSVPAQTRVGEETQTLHPGARVRTAYEEREVAADAVPLNREPDEVVQGDCGLVRCAMLNDRMHALTVDTAGEVAVWDVVRGTCLGRYLSEDVAAASFCGSEASVRGDSDGGSIKELMREERGPREALQTVRERIEGEAVVPAWASVDTKTGVLTVHLSERCFEAEVYADEAGLSHDRRYGDEFRVNIGKWILRNLFYGFIREEQRTRRREEPAHRMHRASAPSHIDVPAHDHHPRRSLDSLHQSSSSSPRSSHVLSSPTMLPAMSPAISMGPRTPLLTPLIPINSSERTAGLSPIPQSPNDSTPMPPRTQQAEGAPGSLSSSDYFSLRARRESMSTAGSVTTSDDFSSWGKDSGSQTPSTPSAVGFIGRINRAFGKSVRRQASEIGTPATSSSGNDAPAIPAVRNSCYETIAPIPHKSPVQALLSGPINPPSATDNPPLPISPHTSVIISEEALSGWTTIYRGQVANTAGDMHTLEEVMPYWLIEYLLTNKAPSVPLTKISFVLLPFPAKDPQERLPELVNSAQTKLTASRFLRVRKLAVHVQDKLDRIFGSRSSTSPNTPRSSLDSRSHSSGGGRGESRPRAEEVYEILCNDVVLPLDMTLAAVRQFIWRRAGEINMYYRRKSHLVNR